MIVHFLAILLPLKGPIAGNMPLNLQIHSPLQLESSVMYRNFKDLDISSNAYAEASRNVCIHLSTNLKNFKYSYLLVDGNKP